MKFNKDTIKCISIAERPGSFGLKFHNAGYEFFNLNQIYMPLKVMSDNLESTIQLVRDNFYGCSVSMPHKIKTMDLVDELDESAVKSGAINTILNLGDCRLKGFNTDYIGALTAIKTNIGSLENKKVLMMGAGGVSRAVGNAVKDLGGELYVTNRSEENGIILAKTLEAKFYSLKDAKNFKGDLFINATPVGMSGEKVPFSNEKLNSYEAIMDVVVPNTPLQNFSRDNSKILVPGKLMTTYQARKQFEIYTGKVLPDSFINEFMGGIK